MNGGVAQGAQSNPVSSGTNFGGSVQPSVPQGSSPLQPPISSGTGDIVLTPSTKKSKKGLVIGLLLGFLVLAVGVCAVLYFFVFGDKTNTALSLMRDNVSNVRAIEQVFIDSYFNNLTVAQVFNEKKHEEINNAMNGFSSLQKGLSGIDVAIIDENLQSDYKVVQERLNARVEGFKKSVDFYNTLYTAYGTNNAEGLADLVKSEDYYTALIAERFSNYITEQNELYAVISENSCSLAAGVEATEVCATAVAGWMDNINSLQNSTVVVSAIFDMLSIEEIGELFNTEDIDNIETILITPYINKMIGEEK